MENVHFQDFLHRVLAAITHWSTTYFELLQHHVGCLPREALASHEAWLRHCASLATCLPPVP